MTGGNARLRAAGGREPLTGRARRLSAPHRRGGLIGTLAAIAVMTVLCLLPAFWNGYPLVFADTHGYVNGWRGAFPIVPPYYSLAVFATAQPVSLSFTLLVQAALTGYVLWVFLRDVGSVRSPLLATGCGAVVIGASQLPWVASHVMPDVFAGVGFACLMLVLLAPEKLATPERAVVFAVAVFSAVVSTANILILCVLAAGVAATRLALPGEAGGRRPVAVAAPAYVGIVLFLALLPNKLAYDRWTIHAPSGAMLFSLLVDGGIAEDYLRRHCPEVSPHVCAFLPAIEKLDRREAFLWEGLAHETGAIPDRDGAFARLSRRIIADRPLEVASLILRQTLGQLATVSMGIDSTSALRSYAAPSPVADSISANLPGEAARFAAARQQQGAIRDHYPGRYYVVTTYAGYLVLLALLPAALRTPDRTMATLLVAAIVFVVLGLMVHGGLVYPQPRYHAKVSWVAWLAAAAAAHRLFLAAGPGRRQRGPGA